MTCTRKITPAQGKALAWLRDHGGDATWVKGGATILAQGEVAPFERKTWVALRDAQRIEFKDGRVRALDAAPERGVSAPVRNEFNEQPRAPRHAGAE